MDKTKKKAFKHAKRRVAEAAAVRSAESQSRPAVPAIELFQRESCPFSHAVRNRLSALGLDYVAHNVPADSDFRHEQLVQAGGKDQIPFLIDHSSGVKLYDSQAINAYLENEYGEPAVSPLERLYRRAESRLRTRTDQALWLARRPIERFEKLRHDLSDFGETILGTLRMARSQFRSETERARSRSEAPAQGAAAGDELNGGELQEEVA